MIVAEIILVIFFALLHKSDVGVHYEHFWLAGGFVLLRPAYAQTDLENNRDGRGLQFHPANSPTGSHKRKGRENLQRLRDYGGGGGGEEVFSV